MISSSVTISQAPHPVPPSKRHGYGIVGLTEDPAVTPAEDAVSRRQDRADNWSALSSRTEGTFWACVHRDLLTIDIGH